ncbi:hypothetical protein [Gilliamella sp. ESL0254]|uniref:hypothetical protein n=1 Tax=Gilliamella sp. ESL0254 TaxID=2705035 RepID=UPI00158012E1|nr:hypothetical protein [Gilliamella sp. ESL0254]NUF27150.1 hypothetical protein [Gilliamella sp. ESL0254]
MFWLCSFGAQALTAQTSRVIEGSGPYLTSDGGQTKVTDLESLLTITLPHGVKVSPSTNTSSRTNPIVLSTWRTLGDIKTIFPPSTTYLSLNDLVNRYHYWGDDDGDGGVTATGTLWLSLHDKNGDTVRLNDTLDACKAPYQLTIGLSSDGGSLTTQYGVPNRRVFSTTNDRETYYFSPNENCFFFVQSVRPNLLYGGTTGRQYRPQYAGPSNIWNPTKGFLTQSTRSSSYGQNFPTTGTNGVYFDLEMPAGVDGSQLSWTVNTSGRIRADVRWVRPSRSSSYDKWITDKSSYVTRVWLSGPVATYTQQQSANPSPLERPSLPQKFELVGRDGDGREVRYGFVLQKWFVSRGNKGYFWSDEMMSWCSRLGYRVARLRDLTNSKCGVDNTNFPCQNGIDGATPRSSGNYYMRHIGAGFFSEWGNMEFYHNSDFGYSFWLNESKASSLLFSWGIVILWDQSVGRPLPDGHIGYNIYSSICTTP